MAVAITFCGSMLIRRPHWPPGLSSFAAAGVEGWLWNPEQWTVMLALAFSGSTVGQSLGRAGKVLHNVPLQSTMHLIDAGSYGQATRGNGQATGRSRRQPPSQPCRTCQQTKNHLNDS